MRPSSPGVGPAASVARDLELHDLGRPLDNYSVLVILQPCQNREAAAFFQSFEHLVPDATAPRLYSYRNPTLIGETFLHSPTLPIYLLSTLQLVA